MLKSFLVFLYLLFNVQSYAFTVKAQMDVQTNELKCTFTYPNDFIEALVNSHWEVGITEEMLAHVRSRLASDLDFRLDSFLGANFEWVAKGQEVCFSYILLRDLLNSQTGKILDSRLIRFVNAVEKIGISKNLIIKKLLDKIKQKTFISVDDFIFLSSLSDAELSRQYLSFHRVHKKYLNLSYLEKEFLHKEIIAQRPRSKFAEFALDNFDYEKYFSPVVLKLDKDFSRSAAFSDEKLYSEIFSNLDVVKIRPFAKDILMKTKSRNKLVKFFRTFNLDFLKNDLGDDRCQIFSSIVDKFLEADISFTDQEIIEKFHKLKVDCFSAILNSKELFSADDKRFFSKWCLGKRTAYKCPIFFNKKWKSKVKTCSLDSDCKVGGRYFHFNKNTYEDEVAYYLEEESHLMRIFQRLPEEAGGSVCFEKQCQPDLPFCKPSELFEKLLSPFVKRENNKCATDADCTSNQIPYNPDNDFKLFLPSSKIKDQEKIYDEQMILWRRFFDLKDLCRSYTQDVKDRKKHFYLNFEKYKVSCIENFCQMRQ